MHVIQSFVYSAFGVCRKVFTIVSTISSSSSFYSVFFLLLLVVLYAHFNSIVSFFHSFCNHFSSTWLLAFFSSSLLYFKTDFRFILSYSSLYMYIKLCWWWQWHGNSQSANQRFQLFNVLHSFRFSGCCHHSILVILFANHPFCMLCICSPFSSWWDRTDDVPNDKLYAIVIW